MLLSSRPVLYTLILTGLFLIFSTTASNASTTSCTSDGERLDSATPHLSTPFQLAFQPKKSSQATGILLCRNVYGFRIGYSKSITAPTVVGLDIGLPFSTAKKVNGIQLSMIGNILADNLYGLQISGIYNASSKFTGIQFAPILNLADGNNKAYGLQVGLINFFDQGGVQAGFLNIAATSSFQVGVVSASAKSRVQVSLLSNIEFDLVEHAVDAQLGGLIFNFATSIRLFQGVGVVNFAGNLSGIQAGIVNMSLDKLTGLQVGIINIVDVHTFKGDHGYEYAVIKGVQLGIINKAESINGLQIGLINSADELKGVQIGGLNINHSGPIKFSPLLNIGF